MFFSDVSIVSDAWFYCESTKHVLYICCRHAALYTYDAAQIFYASQSHHEIVSHVERNRMMNSADCFLNIKGFQASKHTALSLFS